MPLDVLDVPNFDSRAVPIEIWLLGTWYALSAGVVCLWLCYAGLPHAKIWLAGLATAVMPVAALGELFNPARIAGAVLVIGGVVLGANSPAASIPSISGTRSSAATMPHPSGLLRAPAGAAEEWNKMR